jgi:hypothetical protein
LIYYLSTQSTLDHHHYRQHAVQSRSPPIAGPVFVLGQAQSCKTEDTCFKVSPEGAANGSAQTFINKVCASLVGNFVKDERRLTCTQFANGLKYD